MNTTNCEDILMAAMAAADGEETGLPLGEIETHLAGCESCRFEVEKGESILRLLKAYERHELNADLWPAISGRIEANTASATWQGWYIFAAFASMLVVYKFVEMLPEKEPGYWLKIAPVIAAAALFVFLKENHFKINTELISE